MFGNTKLTRNQRKAFRVQERREIALIHMEKRIKALKNAVESNRLPYNEERRVQRSIEFLTSVCSRTKQNFVRTKRGLSNKGPRHDEPTTGYHPDPMEQNVPFRQYTLDKL